MTQPSGILTVLPMGSHPNMSRWVLTASQLLGESACTGRAILDVLILWCHHNHQLHLHMQTDKHFHTFPSNTSGTLVVSVVISWPQAAVSVWHCLTTCIRLKVFIGLIMSVHGANSPATSEEWHERSVKERLAATSLEYQSINYTFSWG